MVIVYHSAFCRSDMEVVVFPGNTSPVVNVYSEQSLDGRLWLQCIPTSLVWMGRKVPYSTIKKAFILYTQFGCGRYVGRRGR